MNGNHDQFVITIARHRVLGTILQPCWVSGWETAGYFSAFERITNDNLANFADQIGTVGQSIVRKCEEFGDKQLMRTFTKKKISPQEFYNNLTEKDLVENLRPYIERRMAAALSIVVTEKVPLLLKSQHNNIYQSDEIVPVTDPAETVFNFHRDEEGLRYFLTISCSGKDFTLTGKNALLLCNEPCFLVLEGKLFHFSDIDGKKLTPFFAKPYISIPKQTEKKYFQTFVVNAIRQYRVRAKGFELVEKPMDFQPVLSLENALDGTPSLLLRFRYGKSEFIGGQVTDPEVTLTDSGSPGILVEVVRRDDAGEQRSGQRLAKLGLIKSQGAFYQYPSATASLADDRLYDLVCWINQYAGTLLNEGYVVQQRLGEKRFYTGHSILSQSVSEKPDWFDLRLILEVEGFKIPFVRLRRNILQGIREFALPDGSVFIIPAEWMEKYHQLMLHSRDDNDQLRVMRVHYTLLKSCIEMPGEELLATIGQLNSADAAAELPRGVQATLRPYQLMGFYWMLHMQRQRLGVCLADDMGLGKTLQTLALLHKLLPQRSVVTLRSTTSNTQLSLFEPVGEDTGPSIYRPCLIVMPTSLIYNWQTEIQRFIPGYKVVAYTGSNRLEFGAIYRGYDIILTTYGIVRNDIEVLRNYSFFYLILDESQMVKNPESKTYQSVLALDAENRLILTGTPLENSLSDLWAQMNFLNRGMLGNFSLFKREYMAGIEGGNERLAQKLKDIVGPFMLRRTKGQVAADLPELTEQLVSCAMDEDQERMYESEKSKIRNTLLLEMANGPQERHTIMVLQAMTRLRQLACHPAMVTDDYHGESGKFEEVWRSLLSVLSEGSKVLMFSSFVKHLSLYRQRLDTEGVKYSWLTGETIDRQEAIEQFRNDPDTRVFLISIKAGGTGLNLTEAEYVFILDPWWNPAVENQAIARAHRIGQQNKVFVYRFVSGGSIEEKILLLQQRKHQLSDEFVNDNNALRFFSNEEVMEMFA